MAKSPVKSRRVRSSEFPGPTPAELLAMANDPMAFFSFVVIPTVDGPRRFGEVMVPEQRAILSDVAPSLRAIALGQKPPIGRFWREAAKGWAKSQFQALEICWLAMFTRVPIYAQIAASDKDQASEALLHAKNLAFHGPWIGQRIEIQSWKIIGRNFECEVTASVDAGSHGARPQYLAIDEVHAIQKDSVTLNHLDNANKVAGIVCLSTNAGFVDSPAYELREIARESPRWNYHAITYPPPWVNPEDIADSARRNSAERQARLWHGVWSEGSGEGLDAEDIQACTIHRHDMTRMSELELRDYRWWGGADLGVRKDRSAYCVVGIRRGHPNMRVAFCKSWAPIPGKREVDLAEVERFILRSQKKFKTETLNLDFHQAAYLQQRLSRQGVRCENVSFGPKSLTEMASMILTLTKCRTLELNADDKDLIRDLKRIQIVDTQWGQKITALSTSDGHCDSASSLIYAAMPAAKWTAGGGESVDVKPSAFEVRPDGSRYGLLSGGRGAIANRDFSVEIITFRRPSGNGWMPMG